MLAELADEPLLSVAISTAFLSFDGNVEMGSIRTGVTMYVERTSSLDATTSLGQTSSSPQRTSTVPQNCSLTTLSQSKFGHF
jgi:hypothetical protein